MSLSDESASRRQALGRIGTIAIGAVTLSWTSLLPAAAQESDTEGGNTATTAPPPDEGLSEVELLAFMESVERSAASAYGKALARLGASKAALAPFQAHHETYATTLAGLAGLTNQFGKVNPVLTQVTEDQLRDAADDEAVHRILRDLENALSGTQLAALETLGDSNAKTVAAILVVNAQHATVLDHLIDPESPVSIQPFEIVDQAMPPEAFPIKEDQ